MMDRVNQILRIRKIFSQVEEVHYAGDSSDEGPPLRKVAVCAVVKNPYANRSYEPDLTLLFESSMELGSTLGAEALRQLGAPVESYGKGGLVGISGEQEHINATLTSTFGDAFRSAIGGGEAWIVSTTKIGSPGETIDIPLAFKDEVWVRSHYDSLEVRVPDSPLPDELVVIVAVTNRGRLNARVGGMTVEQASMNQ